MKMAIYGYARVSTNGQSLGDQIAALRAAGATMIYKEKISGIRADRLQLAKMIKALGAGDVVVVSRLDRLARSTRDLLNIVDRHRQGRRVLQVSRRCLGRVRELGAAR
jgi:DNA invertase Pin-like site-specific DNA recombinase